MDGSRRLVYQEFTNVDTEAGVDVEYLDMRFYLQSYHADALGPFSSLFPPFPLKCCCAHVSSVGLKSYAPTGTQLDTDGKTRFHILVSCCR